MANRAVPKTRKQRRIEARTAAKSSPSSGRRFAWISSIRAPSISLPSLKKPAVRPLAVSLPSARESMVGAPALPRPSAPAFALHLSMTRTQVIAFAAVLLFAAILRLADLGSRAFHYDESLHALFSWQLFKGDGYVHDPSMHGPFQFFAGATSFAIFGVTDFTARIPHALFGVALVAMPFLLRKQIGFKAALIAAVMLAISPTVLYYSRFDREDIFGVVWTSWPWPS